MYLWELSIKPSSNFTLLLSLPSLIMVVKFMPLLLTLFSKLYSIHHAGLCLAFGAFKASHLESLYTESGLPSLHQHQTLMWLRPYTRAQQLPTFSLQLSSIVSTFYLPHPHLSCSFLLTFQPLLTSCRFSVKHIPPFRPLLLSSWLLPCPSMCPPFWHVSKSTSLSVV